MQAITRGWVVQVTSVHEKSSPRAACFCFEFCTVVQKVGGGMWLRSHAWAFQREADPRDCGFWSELTSLPVLEELLQALLLKLPPCHYVSSPPPC